METPTEILIVEDDPDIAELLEVTFAKEGWHSSRAADGEAALALLASRNFSACVLDLMLPGMDGLAVLRSLRGSAQGRELPVVIASARGEDSDIVSGLDLGADDYLAKPFSPKVLAARLRAILRRSLQADPDQEAGGEASQESADEPLKVSGVLLDPRKHKVEFAGVPIALSATEFAVLELFMREPGRVFTRSQTISLVKGEDYPVTDRALDVHILSLRRKLGEAGEFIETVRGIGYRFKDLP
ncbi:MAG: response regulator transcription factor [Rectinema sp.]